MKKEEKIKIIKSEILNYYNVTEQDFNSTSRKSENVKPRHIFVYMIRYELGLTFREIAKLLNKEVSTVIRNFQNISDLIYNDKNLQSEIKELREIIRKQIETIV